MDQAEGDFIAFIDDDVRLEPSFFAEILATFTEDTDRSVGGVVGYFTNQFLDPDKSRRWRWYRRLRLFTTYEPGRYDYKTGYPINRYLQPPHQGVREVDFMGTNCAVWRREVFDQGLRLSPFFTGYGILEDAHFALRARKHWLLLENGRAEAIHLHSPRSRVNNYEIAFKSAVNYRFVFLDVVEERSWRSELRFWRVQLVDFLRFASRAVAHPGRESFDLVRGKVVGLLKASRMKASPAPRQR